MSNLNQLSTRRYEATAYLSRTSPYFPLDWFVYKKGTLLYDNGRLSFTDQNGQELFMLTPKELKVGKETFWITLIRMKLKIIGGKRWWVGFYPNMISENLFIAPANVAKIDTFVELVNTGHSSRLANRNDSVYVEPPRSLEIFAYVLTIIVGLFILGLVLLVVVFILLAVLRTIVH